MNRLRRIGISLGDINGIGPEVALRAAFRARTPGCRVILVGSSPHVIELAQRLRLPTPKPWTPGQQPFARVHVWDPDPLLVPRLQPGEIHLDASRAAMAWVRAATNACLRGELDALVTAPICKEGLLRAKLPASGHTEFLAKLSGTRRFAMMLMGGKLRVALVTRHLPLAHVARSLTSASIGNVIGLVAEALPWLGAPRRPIAVCALNPHAGDGGALGQEERTIIAPAIRRARRSGWNVAGPVPADVVFHQALQGKFSAVVAMYHDQGLAPLKMLAFDEGVNLTLGLPFVRTSPDHGTAFDLAGKGRANPSSMVAAIHWAARLAKRPHPWRV